MFGDSDVDFGPQKAQENRRNIVNTPYMKTSIKTKLASRKLWVAIGGLLAVFATEWAGLEPAMAEKIIQAICIIVPSYVAGQGVVDAVLAYAKKGDKA